MQHAIDELQNGNLDRVLMLKLLAGSRDQALAARNARTATTAARSLADAKNLELQSLQYEIRSIKQQIHSCGSAENQGVYPDIPMFSKEEFSLRAPPSLQSSDPHALALNMLNFELSERKRLTEILADKKRLKLKHSLDIQTKRNSLLDLDSQIRALILSTAPLQKQLGISITADQTEHESASPLTAEKL